MVVDPGVPIAAVVRDTPRDVVNLVTVEVNIGTEMLDCSVEIVCSEY